LWTSTARDAEIENAGTRQKDKESVA
jgi:hypothetical protein